MSETNLTAPNPGLKGWPRDDHHCVAFFDATSRALSAYRGAMFSAVSISNGSQRALLKGMVRLSIESPRDLLSRKQINEVSAEQIQLPLDGSRIFEFLEEVASGGGWASDGQTVRLLPESSSRYSAYFESIEQGRPGRRAGDCLIISGEHTATVIGSRQPRVLRDLETHAFESLDELVVEYGCDLGQRDRTSLSILLEPPCKFTQDCAIKGVRGRVVIVVPRDLPFESFQVAVRSIDKSGEHLRLALIGSNFQWTDRGSYCVGDCEFRVPVASVCECRVSFAGRVFDRIELADPAVLPNARRRVVEIHDQGLKKLSSIFAKCQEGDQKALKQFEPAVALLFHLLGFDTTHIGAIRGNSDGPDIYAWTASGALVVIECTTGQFDEKKFQNFLVRARNASDAVASLPTRRVTNRVATIVVTSNARRDCGPQLLQAEKQGALLLCASDLYDAVARAAYSPDSDAMLVRWGNAAMWRYLAAPSLD